MSEQRVVLKVEDAIKLLPDGNDIHTFRGGGSVLIGCDWDRADIIKAMIEFGVELSGEQATRMNHGLCLKDKTGWLFIETKKS